MVKTVFTSPVPLVNLSTSDIIASLITLTLRRTSINAEDPLVPALVECVSSLGTHVYYADQIQDLAAELISRLVIVEASGIPGGTKSSGDKSRMQAVRCLLAGLLGLIHAADMHDTGKDGDAEDDKDGTPRKLGTSPALPSAVSSAPQEEHVRPSRRTKIAPEVWQDTLTLLCDEDYAVRADYAIALVSYIQKEIPKLGECTDPDGVKRTRPLAEGPSQRVSTVTAMMYGDATTRFLNALHAYVYALATSSTLGLYSSSSSSSPERSVNGSGALEGNQSRESPAHSRRSITVPSRSRKCSIVLHVLHQAPTRITSPISIAAVLSDYTDILAVLIAVHEQLPVRGLLTGLPMLLALDRAVQVEEPADAGITQLLWTIKKVVAQTWAAIGKVWDCPMVIEMAEKVLSVAVNFEADASIDGPLPSLDTEALIAALTSNQNVQDATGLDQQALSRRLGISWTAESAFRDSLETQTNFDSLRGDGLSPLIKVAPALMHVENLSLQSLARSTRGVGVTDLREALEGRSSMSNPNLANKAPSISTLDHMSAIVPGEPFPKLTPTRSRPQRGKPRPGEVRDVLNKLGIGKQNGSSMLRSSFPLQKSQSRNAPAFSAPYKT
ncbi:Protein EFR3 [Grifola frondosa]|uniref:Protein EFR3 n=1 Tax=Grifola frondosa TaxID=5627 RepID=A0A1C7M1D9_GRIFR|nr:Protein EFR3 [Grifola frondosa]